MSVGHGTGSAFAINHGSAITTLDSNNGTIAVADANTILVVGLALSLVTASGVDIVLDPTGVNQALTLLGAVSNSTNDHRVWIFGLLSPNAAGASRIVRATWTGSAKAVIVGDTFTGVDQGSLAASAVFTSQTGTSTAPSIAIPTASGDATFDFICDNEVASLSAPTPQTLISAIDNTIIDCGAGYFLSTTSSDTHRWTYGSSVPWAMGALRLIQVGGVGGTTIPFVPGHTRPFPYRPGAPNRR